MAAVTNREQFEALFGTGTGFPGTEGHWRSDTGGSTGSSDTGPSPNNVLPFVHTETSGSASLSQLETNGVVQFLSVPEGPGRQLTLRVCIQGNFGDGTEGLEIEYRTGPAAAWQRAAFIPGWAYASSRTAGQTFTDEGGTERTVVANGGWIDVDTLIPDNATQVRLHPRYVAGTGGGFTHDIALQDVAWSKLTPRLVPNFASDFGAGGSREITHRRWRVGEPVDMLLPEATGGDGNLVYSLSPALPAGLTFTAATRRITGTPTEITARRAYTLTARDTDGDTGSLTFYAEVLRGVGFSVYVNDSDTPLAGVVADSLVVRYVMGSNSTAKFVVRGVTGELIPPPFGARIEIRDNASARTLFRGRVFNPATKVVVSGVLTDIGVSVVGIEEALHSAIIDNVKGIEVAEAMTATEQFRTLIGIVPGFSVGTPTGTLEHRVSRDVRYHIVGDVLTELARLNDAVLIVKTDRTVFLQARSALEENTAELTGDTFARISFDFDSRGLRSRQLVRYGETIAHRTVIGDGAERAFLVAGQQLPVDYLADGVTARALNAEEGDQGLRFRADATAAARTGGGIDFFGGNAGAPASDLFIGATRVGASAVSLRMLTDGKIQLRAGVPMTAAARAALALRHAGSGNPVWTTDGIAPTIEIEGSAPALNAGAEFTMPVDDRNTYHAMAIHGDTVFGLRRVGDERGGTSTYIDGFRFTGGALVRDTRFDLTLPFHARREDQTHPPRRLEVIGDRLHAIRYGYDIDNDGYAHNRDNDRIRSYAMRINAGSLTYLSGENWEIDPPQNASPGTPWVFLLSADKTKAWYVPGPFDIHGNTDTAYGFTVSGGALTRSATDDFTMPLVPRPPGPGTWFGEGNFYLVHGDFVYVIAHDENYNRAGYHVRMIRMRLSTRVWDTNYVDLGGNSSSGAWMFAANGHIFAANPRRLGQTDFEGTTYRAVRVEQDYLQWQAQASDYSTLNTRRAANSGFRIALMDPDIIGVDVPGVRFRPTPVDVQSVTRATLNGADVDIGEDADWRFDIARQKLIQSDTATALTSDDRLAIEYRARSVVQACNPTASIMGDIIETLDGSSGLTYAGALEVATSLLTQYRAPVIRVSATSEPGKTLSFFPGETVALAIALLREHGIVLVDPLNLRWLLTEVSVRYKGSLEYFEVTGINGPFRELSSDWWRQLLGHQV